MKKLKRSPRILLTNDDGINAPGLEALFDIASQLSAEIYVIAPETDESGTGQSISLHRPLRCRLHKENWWAVSGTPADCVAIAIGHILKKRPPDIILSGVNAGRNTGDDVNLSGTLGAVFMSLMLGYPAIGMSLECNDKKKARWDTVRALGPSLLRHFFDEGWPEQTCLSINIPNRSKEKIKGLTWARQGDLTTKNIVIEERTDLRDVSYYWMTTDDRPAPDGSTCDLGVLEKGDVVVTALGLNRSIEISKPRLILKSLASKTARG